MLHTGPLIFACDNVCALTHLWIHFKTRHVFMRLHKLIWLKRVRISFISPCRVRGQAKPYASLLWIKPRHAYSSTTVRLLWLQAVHFGTFTMKHSRTLLLLNMLPSQEPSYWRNSPMDTPTLCMCAHRAAARTRHSEHGNAVWLIFKKLYCQQSAVYK